ncbi:Vitamin K-dependent gamma-carboxylase [Gemmata obscuriglobus]|nr:HTTM domain-containing protein [Gemmata obscuriglobus]QEG25446.1 Vitamin K-dependent gamma-carboxylase [Gemmata obscuriglobus]VTR98603.1 vitamin k-dependent gamma-carboxylase : Vitamin K-dependent gamma-carboxylase OS=Mycobacterium smegmatis JS623 GN=Mycsm_05272 PE=4 SV=1: VKG_Carbox [Gemmata obscuriglobus UQM 2246]
MNAFPESETRFVGIQPRLPGPLKRWAWLLRPVPAERMAALRVAVAVAALLDIGIACAPQFATYFFEDGLGGPNAYPSRFRSGHYYWSLLRVLPPTWGPVALMSVWVVAAVALLVGSRPFVSALVCWACAVSFWNINYGLCNGGDQIRNSLFLAVAVGRTGAVWGVESVRRRGFAGRVFVPGWPAKVLLVQFVCLYVFSAVYKLVSPGWQTGYVMYFVNHDLEWSLTPNLSPYLPPFAHRLSSWVAIGWELAFPVLLAFRRTRVLCLVMGVAFHIITFLTLEVGHFALYSLAFYVLFVPWELMRTRKTPRNADFSSVSW